MFLYYQGHEIDKIEDIAFFKDVIFDEKLRGIFTPRYELFKIVRKRGYDFAILIDDDLFMYPDTSYATAMDWLDFKKDAGAVSIATHFYKCRNEIKNVSDSMGYFNVDGGMVFPIRSINIILDYFKDKEQDYTEDMVWLLLYVKGYDLYYDYHSKAHHQLNAKNDKKEYTGYAKMRFEKPYNPILSEWFNDTELTTENGRWSKPINNIKCLRYINANGIAERKRNRGKTEN